MGGSGGRLWLIGWVIVKFIGSGKNWKGKELKGKRIERGNFCKRELRGRLWEGGVEYIVGGYGFLCVCKFWE